MLEQLRNQIDEVDQQIIDLLALRFELVKKVWERKKQNNIAPLQPKRWEKVLQTRKSWAKQKGVNPDLVEKIWNLIHKEVLNLEQ